jgi:hypothetical protein
MEKKELWRDIPGYEGYYQASNLGRIKSTPRHIRFVNKKGDTSYRLSSERILKPSLAGKYLKVTLAKYGKNKTIYIHHLVYSAFKGQIEKGLVIDHIDENRLNNCIENLQSITIRENVSKGWAKFKPTSSFPGVIKFKGKWRASIRHKGKRYHLGYFNTEPEAVAAYKNKLSSLTI